MTKGKLKNMMLRWGIFLLIVMLLLQGLSWILVPRTNTKKGGLMNYRSRGFYSETVNSLDVVGIGNSDLGSALCPMVLWKNEGITAYTCAENKQQINQAYYLLKEVLNCQKPKVVMLEVDCLFQESVRSQMSGVIKGTLKYLFPAIDYHDRWKDLKLSDMMASKKKLWHDRDKGYYYNTDVVPYTGGEYMSANDKNACIDPVSQMYLDDIVKLCQEQNIQLMMIEMPSTNSWNQSRHDAVAEYAKNKNVPFVDMNQKMDDFKLDWTKDTRDAGNHLNYNGAQKVSQWLSTYLKNNYELTDHRQDSAFSEWFKDAAAFEKRPVT